MDMKKRFLSVPDFGGSRGIVRADASKDIKQ
jgi:hypothetical protein